MTFWLFVFSMQSPQLAFFLPLEPVAPLHENPIYWPALYDICEKPDWEWRFVLRDYNAKHDGLLPSAPFQKVQVLPLVEHLVANVLVSCADLIDMQEFLECQDLPGKPQVLHRRVRHS